MSAISPAWAIRKSGTDYTTERDNQNIIYRANKPSEAFLLLNNSDKALSDVFVNEEEVTLKIGSQNMMVGFIDDITDVHYPTKKMDLKIHVVNFTDYYISKQPYEHEYRTETAADDIIIDATNGIPGLTRLINGLNTSNDKIARNFIGTYRKDVLDAVVENLAADYFADETKFFQAWPIGTFPFLESTTLTKYKIIDGTPAAANQLRVSFEHDIKFVRSVANMFRKVTVTNGLQVTFPSDIELYQTVKLTHPTVKTAGGSQKEFSAFYGSFGDNPALFNGNNLQPFIFNTGKDFGGKFPGNTVQVMMPNAATPASILMQGVWFDALGNKQTLDLNIDPLEWKYLGFFIKNGLTGPAVTSMTLRLLQSGSSGHWFRNIYPDIINKSGSRTDITYLQYDLPTNITDATSNGWTRSGFPTKIDKMSLVAAPSTGYTANSYLEFGKLFFYGLQRGSSSTIPGTPATEKIMVNSTITKKDVLKKLADKELTRVNSEVRKPDFTIAGNTAFRFPGRNIDVDFSSLFGSNNRKADNLRIEEIEHRLSKGVHWTDIFLDTSFNRK